MMTRKLLPITILVLLFMVTLTGVVLAQGEPPPPYAGLKNPFPWDSSPVQEAGKKLYQQSCLGCHGVRGEGVAKADFSHADYQKNLVARPDISFWLLSEGRLDRGMPPFKSSLSEEQRWQVLTYLWSLAQETPAKPTPPPTAVTGGNLLLSAPPQAQSGQLLTLKAMLQDDQGKPIENATVKFYLRVDFFVRGLMEIGEAQTDGNGVAVLEYAPREAGSVELVARYNSIETTAPLTLAEADKPFYQAEAGIKLPTVGKEIFIGPESAHELGKMGEAPTSAFRLPGGILSWLLLVVVTVALIWLTYFRVVYQVFRIPTVKSITGTNTRLLPLIGLIIVSVIGIGLVLKLLIGPYSNFHLVP